MLTRKEVAAKLGVHPDTVVRLVERGLLRETRLPSARGHRSIPRYSEAALRAYIASGYSS